MRVGRPWGLQQKQICLWCLFKIGPYKTLNQTQSIYRTCCPRGAAFLLDHYATAGPVWATTRLGRSRGRKASGLQQRHVFQSCNGKDLQIRSTGSPSQLLSLSCCFHCRHSPIPIPPLRQWPRTLPTAVHGLLRVAAGCAPGRPKRVGARCPSSDLQTVGAFAVWTALAS